MYKWLWLCLISLITEDWHGAISCWWWRWFWLPHTLIRARVDLLIIWDNVGTCSVHVFHHLDLSSCHTSLEHWLTPSWYVSRLTRMDQSFTTSLSTKSSPVFLYQHTDSPSHHSAQHQQWKWNRWLRKSLLSRWKNIKISRQKLNHRAYHNPDKNNQ